jgi:hypothetical protein
VFCNNLFFYLGFAYTKKKIITCWEQSCLCWSYSRVGSYNWLRTMLCSNMEFLYIPIRLPWGKFSYIPFYNNNFPPVWSTNREPTIFLWSTIREPTIFLQFGAQLENFNKSSSINGEFKTETANSEPTQAWKNVLPSSLSLRTPPAQPKNQQGAQRPKNQQAWSAQVELPRKHIIGKLNSEQHKLNWEGSI